MIERTIDILFSAHLSSADAPVSVLFVLLFFGTFASEDLTCIFAGTWVSTGRIGFVTAVAACYVGILTGDILLYACGRIFGDGISRLKIVRRLITPERWDQARQWLEDRGARAVFLSRFVSGLRLPVYFAAGALRTSFQKFAFYFAAAALVWTPLIVGSGTLWQSVISGSYLLSALFGIVVVRFLFKLTNRRSRRILYARLKRILDWEFWPIQIFYLPVVVYILFLAARHRSFTVFTATNPGIFSGGFVGESKDDIYRLIARSDNSKPHLLIHSLIDRRQGPDEKFESASEFMRQNGLSYPIVVKPDKGERGKDVTIAHSPVELRTCLSNPDFDVLIQEYCSGVEVSIFYYRFPSEERGKIFSITEKRFPCLIGDGKSDVETLILNDARAACMAASYFARNAARLREVPPVGERVELIDIGTHSRGCVFLDGEWMRSAKLEDKICEIAGRIKGFNFGRFDIRTDSFEDISNGENFKIIELNGVTSESTNIYDPQFNLIDAYRILFKQWRIAFEIGTDNMILGAPPTKLSQLLSLAFTTGKRLRGTSIQCA